MNTSMCVVIPVHTNDLTHNEVLSLKACKQHLNSYNCFLVHPKGLNVNEYTKIYDKLILFPVDKRWLCSIEAYNKMKINILFYNLFNEYDFMLTYELDAYIFSSDWDRANCFKYDYIGAPWFENFGDTNVISRVGNSGFSLRKISQCINVLQKRKSFESKWSFLVKLKINKVLPISLIFKFFDKAWKLQLTNYFLSVFFSNEHINEDIFWSDVIPQLFDFKISGIKDAIKFSFEKNPNFLFKENNYELPVGCHGWNKYDEIFWRKYIKG